MISNRNEKVDEDIKEVDSGGKSGQMASSWMWRMKERMMYKMNLSPGDGDA